MSCGYNNVVELLNSVLVSSHVRVSNFEFGNVFEKLDVSCHTVELDELFQALSFEPLDEVPLENLSGQIRRH